MNKIKQKTIEIFELIQDIDELENATNKDNEQDSLLLISNKKDRIKILAIQIATDDNKDVSFSMFTGIKERVLLEVSRVYAVNLKDLMFDNSSRVRELVMARQTVMFIANILGESLLKSASYFGKDHSTCLHAKRTILNLYETDKHFKIVIISLLKTLDFHLNESIVKKFREVGIILTEKN